MARAPRNVALVPGVSSLSRSQSYQKKAMFLRKKTAIPKKVALSTTTKTVKVGGAKNGGTRVVDVVKAPRFYQADDIAKPKLTRKTARPAHTRAAITPGTILILLAGRYRGKRVVFLKTLPSGLLLVSGPRKINGVPLRRVNQVYVIATSTKINIEKINIDAKITDVYFKSDRIEKSKATEEALLGAVEKKPASAERIKDQKTLDTQLLSLIKKQPLLKQYLNASFALSKGQYPHAIKF